VELLVEKGNPSCVTDVGTAGALVRAGAAAAAYNVRVNLSAIADESRRAGFAARADEALTEIKDAADRIATKTETMLNQESGT
jgi:formiminotetrahydrofolate cyclodeaminase